MDCPDCGSRHEASAYTVGWYLTATGEVEQVVGTCGETHAYASEAYGGIMFWTKEAAEKYWQDLTNPEPVAQ